MAVKTAAVASILAALATGGVGIWFWQTEASYHNAHPFTPLAPVLQWAGIGLVLAAVSMLLTGYAIFRAAGAAE